MRWLVRETTVAWGLVAAGVLLRLRHLTAGLVGSHGWRQADVAMIADNFYRDGIDLLHPRIDWAGPLPGYVGTELPLIPVLIALLYRLFGEHLWLGRLVSVAFGTVAMVVFYRLVRGRCGPERALVGLAVFAFSPLAVYYSRTLMPESAMLCGSVLTIFLFSRWCEDGGWRHAVGALLVCALTLLIKLPAAVIGLPMAYLAWRRWRWAFVRRPGLWLFGVLALVPSVLWYLHAGRLAAAHEPFHRFGEESWLWQSGLGVLLEPGRYVTLVVHAAAFLVTPLGLPLVLAGAVLVLRRPPRDHLFHWWAAGLLIYLVLGFVGFHHEYYQLPFLPVVAVLVTVAVEAMTSWSARSCMRQILVAGVALAMVVSALVLVESRYHSDMDRRLWQAGVAARERLPDDALILAADWGNPVLLFAAEARGWHFPGRTAVVDDCAQWTAAGLERRRTQGAGYLVAPTTSADAPVSGPVTRRILAFGAMILPPPERVYVDTCPELTAYLAERYPEVLRNEFVVIFDLGASP